MNLNLKYLIPFLGAGALMTGCASKSHPVQGRPASTGESVRPGITEEPVPVPVKDKAIAGAPPMMMPKALLYKTNGDYLDNLPVQLNPDGSLLSYPSPADIPAGVHPIMLADGWILNPIGVSQRTVFTRYRLEEYRALEKAPTPGEILKAVIPGAKVEITLQAPMTLQEAMADTAAVNRFILSRSK